MPPHTWSFDAIGTRWTVETENVVDAAVRGLVGALIEAFDHSWSRFRSDSLVSALGSGGAAPAPADAAAMLDLYEELSAATDGAVNPLVGRSLAAIGYDADYSLRAGDVEPAPPDWRARLTWGEGRLRLSGEGVIDVGALGKGRLVDLVHALLTESVDGDVMVDAGGDLATSGRSLRVGLEHPRDPTRVIGVWTIRDEALCASATNRRAWGDGLHHVLDGRTGLPVRSVLATWTVADDAMRADAASTALFFDGGAELCARWGVRWVRMLSTGRIEFSPSCTAELFTRTGSVER